MYTYRATRKSIKGVVVSATLTAASAFLFIFSITNAPAYKSIFQLASVVIITFAVLFLSRFVITVYEYTVDGDLFTVKEKRGNKFIVSARINVSDIAEVLCISNGRMPKSGPLRRKTYDYRPDLLPKEYCMITVRNRSYCDDGEELCILIQPDEILKRMLS